MTDSIRNKVKESALWSLPTFQEVDRQQWSKAKFGCAAKADLQVYGSIGYSFRQLQAALSAPGYDAR